MIRTTHRGPGTAGRTACRSSAALVAVLSVAAVLGATACNDDSPTQPEPVGTLVGPAGGTVTVDDVTLVIPAGALTAATDIVIQNVADAGYATDPFFIDGTAHRIEPAGLSLRGAGATLTIRYDPGAVPQGYFPQRLGINDLGPQRRVMAQNQVRLQEHAVEAHIERLGTYGVAGPDPDKMHVGSVVLEPTSLGLALGETGQLEATALCDGGLPLDRVINWSSSDAAVATVNEGGLVTGVAEGGATVSAETEGVSATAAVTVAGTVAEVIVSPASFTILEGDAQQLVAEARDANGNVLTRPFTWSSGNETVATVDANGLVQGLLPGSAVISAAAEGVRGDAAASVAARIASIVVSPATLDLMEGDVVQLSATAYDGRGNAVATDVVWTSSDEAIATISATGLLTAHASGTVTVTAGAGGKHGSSSGTVTPQVDVIILGGVAHGPLGVGVTRQLTATAYDSQGSVVNAHIEWTSSSAAIATVDASGLVTGVSRGTATITASARNGVSASTQIRVIAGHGGGGGEEEDEGGNNLSWPAVFAEGVGITGLPVADDPGVRPYAAEGITVDALPFFYAGNVPDYGPYYAQQGTNTWRAEYVDGTGQPAYDAQIYWGDNITVRTWNATRPIRIEQTLYADGLSLLGFNMVYLSGQGPTELQGTDGTVGPFTPAIYTVDATLKIEKITGKGGQAVATVIEQPTSSEVNVAGKIIYGYLLRLSNWSPPVGEPLEGWYRITFSLGPSANAAIRTVGNAGDELTYIPEVSQDGLSSWIDIYVVP